jgi:hypothetical protein
LKYFSLATERTACDLISIVNSLMLLVLMMLLALFLGTAIELVTFKDEISELLQKKKHAKVRRADHRLF